MTRKGKRHKNVVTFTYGNIYIWSLGGEIEIGLC